MLDPTGRYKGNNFDPNYAAKRKAKMEQQQHNPQRYGKDNYDQRNRDNGYNSRYERDGRGWQGPASLDYGDSGQYTNNYTPRRDNQWENHGDRGYGPSRDYRPNNYSTPRHGAPKSFSPTSAQPRSSTGATRINTPPLAPFSKSRDMDAALKNLIEPPTLPANGKTGTPMGAQGGPGGELSSLEKLKLFKAQVEASRAARSADASSPGVAQVAESFLQRENSNQNPGAEDGEVAEPKSTQANDKAKALKAKLKALKQQKGASGKETGPSSNTNGAQAPTASTGTDLNKNQGAPPVTAPTPSTADQHPQDVTATPRAAPPSSAESSRAMARPPQSYADAARDYNRRRSASPRGRAASPARYPSRTKEPVERRNNLSEDRYADQPPEYSAPRARRDDVARYERSANRDNFTPRQTRAIMAPSTPMPVSSTSINLVVKTLEVIKAQVEQLEVLIQPILDAQAGESIPSVPLQARPPQSPAKDMPPPPAPTYSHQRRSSDSYEQNGQSSYAKRRSSYYDDDDGGYYRSTPTRGGYKKSRGAAGGGRGGKPYYNNYNNHHNNYNEGREGYKRY